MSFLEVFVRRPVFTTMVIATLVVLGLASFAQLGVDIFPKVDLPTITITTRLPGASPEEIESQVTKPIEEVVNTISGLDELRSSTIEGQSQVFASFVLERNVQEAANDVREKVGAILSRFPPGTESPIIEKVDPDSSPVVAIVVSGQRSPREITEIADKRIKRALETVKDVGAITLVGERKREIQIVADPYKLSAFNLSIQQLKEALLRQNVEIPGGRITSGLNEEGLRTLGRIESVDDFNNLIVADFKGSPVRVRDVATVVDGEEEPRTLSRLNGQSAVSLLIRKQSGTNTVAVVDAVKGRLEEVRRGLPQDIRFEIVRDLSRFIKRSFHEVQDHLLLGGLLASLIVAAFIGRLLWWESAVLSAIVAAVTSAFVWGDPETLIKVTGGAIVVTMVFFLAVRRLRPAFVAALAIPCSIIATFTAMRMAGFTLNNLTMLGLSLSTGIVIDDAIIVLENIFRHHEEERRPPFEAAITGTKEIALAVMATTLSLVVIFLPVAFMGGLVGKFWNSFGLTATFAIMVSLVVAFTLTPMLAARLLSSETAATGHGPPGAHGPGARAGSKSAGLYHRIEVAYEALLAWCLRHRLVCFAVAIGILAGGWYLLTTSRLEFVVDDDMSEFEVVAEAPPGSSMERSQDIARAVEAAIRQVPEVTTLFTAIGVRGQYRSNVTDLSIYVGLRPLVERARSQQQIMQDVRQRLQAFPGLRSSVQQLSLISGGGFRQTPFNLILRGPDLARLEQYAQNVIKTLRTKTGFVDLDTAQALRQPEVQVHIDRQRASDLGVRVESVASALRTMVGGEEVGFYREGGEQYDVRLRLKEDARRDSLGHLRPDGARGGGRPGEARQRDHAGARHQSRPDRALRPGALDHHHLEPVRQAPGRRLPRGVRGGDLARPAPGVRHPRQRAREAPAGVAQELPDRLRPVTGVHLHRPRRPVRVVRPPPHHHGVDVPCHPLRAPDPAPGGEDPQHLLDHGALPADGSGEEERDPAGGLHERAAGARPRPRGGPARGGPRPAPAHPHDDPRHHRRHAAGGARQGRRGGVARLAGHRGRGRPGAVPAGDLAHHPGDLLDLRRHERAPGPGLAQIAAMEGGGGPAAGSRRRKPPGPGRVGARAPLTRDGAAAGAAAPE